MEDRSPVRNKIRIIITKNVNITKKWHNLKWLVKLSIIYKTQQYCLYHNSSKSTIMMIKNNGKLVEQIIEVDHLPEITYSDLNKMHMEIYIYHTPNKQFTNSIENSYIVAVSYAQTFCASIIKWIMHQSKMIIDFLSYKCILSY